MDVVQYDSSTSTRQTMTNVSVCVRDEERRAAASHVLQTGLCPSYPLVRRQDVLLIDEEFVIGFMLDAAASSHLVSL